MPIKFLFFVALGLVLFAVSFRRVPITGLIGLIGYAGLGIVSHSWFTDAQLSSTATQLTAVSAAVALFSSWRVIKVRND